MEPDEPAVPAKEPVAAPMADRVAEVVPDDGSRRGEGDDQHDVQTVRVARVDRSSDEHGLPGEGDARALDSDEKKNSHVSIRGEQIEERGLGELH